MARLTVAEARSLAENAMQACGHTPEEARLIADHLIDCELRGLSYGGLPRALSIVERVRSRSRAAEPIRVEEKTAVSALVHGGDQAGYLVAHRAMDLAIAKAKGNGVGIVGGNGTWYTGMLSYYAERMTAANLVCMIASNATPGVAPYGGAEPRFGTNPICFGFPSDDRDPVIWDIGTSAIMHAEVLLAQRLGLELPEGVAQGADGQPTRDPAAVFAGGAIRAWGGAKGSGLAIAVQLLGAMCAAPVMPKDRGEYGCLFVAMSPSLLMPVADFRAAVAEYSAAIRSTRPIAGGPPVRMPFDRSAAERRRRIAADVVEVPDAIHARLVDIVGGRGGTAA